MPLRVSHTQLRLPSISTAWKSLTSKHRARRRIYSSRPNGAKGEKGGDIWEEVMGKEEEKRVQICKRKMAMEKGNTVLLICQLKVSYNLPQIVQGQWTQKNLTPLKRRKDMAWMTHQRASRKMFYNTYSNKGTRGNIKHILSEIILS